MLVEATASLPITTMQQHEDIDIEDVIIGNRFRKELGDIQALADSIREQGLLQPIGIDRDNNLVFGERRLRAFQSMGWSRIPARRVNVTSIVEGEYAENDVREDFRPSERVAIAAAVAEKVGERRGRPSDEKTDNCPELIGKETRDIVAAKSGFSSGKQYERAASVIATNDSELIGAMDSGKLSISAAAKAAILPPETRQEVILAADPKKALREATLIAASGRGVQQSSANRNPLYKPNENYKSLAIVTSYCDSISGKIEDIGASALSSGISDEAMRSREVQTISRCIANLNELMEAINV